MAFSLFKKKTHQRSTDTSLMVLVKEYVASCDVILYENPKIYHHQKTVDVASLMILPNRGIVLFEDIDWEFDTIKDATVSSRLPSSKKSSSVVFDSPLHVINQKFNEVLHKDLNITKGFILFNDLKQEEFDLLDESFHQLIPKSRVLFNDETLDSLRDKLETAFVDSLNITTTSIISTLFMQYTLLSDNEHIEHAVVNEEQKNYIDTEFSDISTLIGPYGSGRSTLMLLKVLIQKIETPKKRFLIIEPTHTACEIMKHRLLAAIEHAIVDVDISTIDIITPKELLTQHAQALYKKPLEPIEITPKMMKKKFNIADVIICDDIELLSDEFIFYLMHIQKGSTLHFVSADTDKAKGNSTTLSKSYRVTQSTLELCKKDLKSHDSYKNISNIKFSEGNIYMETILAFKKILKNREADEKSLIITPNKSFSHALFDEMHDYVEEEISLFDGSQSLVNQAFDTHLIAQYDEIASLQQNYVILSGINPEDTMKFCYALGRAKKNIHVIFNDEDFHDINLEIKEFFE
ncbi:MAG: hypothetical protein U9P71_09820 [Campylobacterota bacterium]|nr:hypothetical protein [Campylobacterota bacterium]